MYRFGNCNSVRAFRVRILWPFMRKLINRTTCIVVEVLGWVNSIASMTFILGTPTQ